MEENQNELRRDALYEPGPENLTFDDMEEDEEQ